MKNISATLAIVWRIAAPYFRSEDRWAACGLLAAVVAIELALVAIDVLVNQWQNGFYSALQDSDWDSLRQGNLDVHRPRLRLRSRWRSTNCT